MDDALTLPELRTLRKDNPQRLFRHLADVQRSFLFGIEDHRDEEERWGGEVRVIVNKNVELHFVPCFNESMRTKEELPQFCVFPSEERADAVEDTSLRLEEDDETIEGAIFYVDPNEYDLLLGSAVDIIERYEDWDVIPDTYFLDSPLVQFIERTVLEHTAVRAERDYDFRRGLVGGAPPPQEELEDEPAPVIGEEDDPAYTPHPDLLLGDGGGEDDEGLDDRGTDEDEAEGDEDEGEGDGEPGDDDEDEGEGGRPKHFRTIWT